MVASLPYSVPFRVVSGLTFFTPKSHFSLINLDTILFDLPRNNTGVACSFLFFMPLRLEERQVAIRLPICLRMKTSCFSAIRGHAWP